MKKFLITAAFLASALVPAKAADVLETAPIASLFDWSGAYIGAQVGYGWMDADRVNTGGFENSFDVDGFLGGVHAGINFQAGSLVYGAEGDLEYSDLDGNDDFVGGTRDDLEVQWLASIRGRVGYALDRVLIYGTAGVAFADVEASNSEGVSDDNTHIGWTVGGGAEFAINERWTTRLEYRYTDFGDDDYNFEPVVFNANYELDMHTVRAGISYKF